MVVFKASGGKVGGKISGLGGRLEIELAGSAGRIGLI
jgi:hypothetical protein